MALSPIPLHGSHVRLEPLAAAHVDALAAIAAEDPSLYVWTTVPQGREAMSAYVEAALAAQAAGTAIPFAAVRQSDGAVIGCTRFFDLEWFPWPAGHARHGLPTPDVGEIGYTWLARWAVRSAANTEAKLLMLTQAFEAWDMLRICLHTDERNQRSREAIVRIGAQFEGILRSHRMASDFIARNSARYSLVAAEWPAAKARLREMLARARD